MAKVIITDRLCKKCGICVAVCPKNVFDQAPGKAPVTTRIESCVACHTCELKCPEFAIEVEAEKK